jgi:competence protein ComEC
MRHHRDAAATLATRVAGPGHSGGRGVLALLLTRLRGTAIAVVAMTLLLMVWGVLSAHQALWPTQHLTGAIRQAEVILSETDGQTSAPWTDCAPGGPLSVSPVGVTLYGELAPAPACAGQHWLMTLRLRPVHGQLNDGGFDSQRYALAQHRPLSGGSSPLPRWMPAAVCAPATWRR